MRISDWSSDVCSSDLRPWTKKAGPLAGPALVDAHASAAGLRLAVPVPATALALVVARVVVAFVAGLALVSAVAMIRREATGGVVAECWLALASAPAIGRATWREQGC